MATTNITGSGTHPQTFEASLCSPVWVGVFKKQSISFSAVNTLFSITAILGNSLILLALHKESSLHPPSKLSSNDSRMMATTNITGNGTNTKTFEGLVSVDKFKEQFISFSAVNILLSITASLGNSLILVALHKESRLHPPSKLLYRCLATTDLLVGLVS